MARSRTTCCCLTEFPISLRVTQRDLLWEQGVADIELSASSPGQTD